MGGYVTLALGGLIAQFASIIDGCDGENARLKFLKSDFGGWFDAVLDRYADALLLFGLTWHAHAAGPLRDVLVTSIGVRGGDVVLVMGLSVSRQCPDDEAYRLTEEFIAANNWEEPNEVSDPRGRKRESTLAEG